MGFNSKRQYLITNKNKLKLKNKRETNSEEFNYFELARQTISRVLSFKLIISLGLKSL